MESWNPSLAEDLLAEFSGGQGQLIPALQQLQERFGYVDREAVPILAGHFNLSKAEVAGVISFYHDFREHPPGRHVVKVCQAEACQAVGARDLTAHVKTVLGVDFHETTPSRDFTLEPVYCLGNCACGPAVAIGEESFGRVTPERFDDILEGVEAEDMP